MQKLLARPFISLVAAVFLLAMVLAFPLSGQRETGSIVGAVTDASQAAIAGAAVVITDLGTGVERRVTSNEIGLYVVNGLPASRYSISVSLKGFTTQRIPEFILRVGQQATANMALKVGDVAEQVLVSGVGAAVDTRSAEVGTEISQQMIRDLPLNGRNVLQLMTVTPGTLPAGNSAYNQGATRPEAGTQLVSSSGGRGNSTAIVLDGGLHEDTYTEVANVLPNPDAIQEFSFETNSYSAKFGGRGGGVVNVITRSGTNSLHGALFEYFRNGELNARNFFGTTNDGLKRNQYGFALGGPARRNKLFFFGSWQGMKSRSRPSTASALVPTAAQRNGDFSARAAQLIDPRSNQPLPNNVIPASQLSPAAQNFLKLIPVAQSPDGFYQYALNSQTNNDQLLGRVDYYRSDRHRISGRYLFDVLKSPGLWDPKNLLTAQNQQSGAQIVDMRWRSQSVMFGDTYTFSPNLLMNTTLSYNRTFNIFLGGPFPSQETFGIKTSNLAHGPEVRTLVSGYFNVRYNHTYRLPRNQYNIQNSWNYVRGRHELAFGVDLVREQSVIENDFESVGRFDFAGRYSGDNLADFIFGKPSAFTQVTSNYSNAVRNLYGAYVQDNYKVTRRLALNLGLRWNPFVHFTNVPHALVTQFNQKAYLAGVHSTRYPNLPAGMLVGGDPGVARSVVKGQYMIFDPRVGFALDVFGNGKTGLRGGIGRYHDQMAGFTHSRPASVPPAVVRMDIVAPASYEDPYQGYVDPFPVPSPTPASQRFPTPFLLGALDPDFSYPNTYQWNLTIDQALPGSIVSRVSYQGSAGRRLLQTADYNAAVLAPGANRNNTNQRRPRPEFTQLQFAGTFAKADYHALVLSLERRLSNGITFLIGYSWQKSTDIISSTSMGDNRTTHPYGSTELDHGLSDFNSAGRFTGSINFPLPFATGKSLSRQVFGGWQANSIINLQTGNPFTVLSGIDNALSGINLDRADIIGNPVVEGDRTRGEQVTRWFNADAFAINALGTFGSVGRNSLIGPGIANVDVSLFKKFVMPFAESQSVEFRTEFYNALNRVNLGLPNANRSSALFGRILTASDPRILQFALRYSF